jgi:GTP-binding protein EngB required for normal cell division
MALNILILGKSGLGKSSFIDCFSNKNYESSPIIRCRTELLSIIPVRSETGNFEIKFIDMPGYDETNTNQYINDVELLISKRLENHLNKLSDKNALRN